MAPKNQRRDVFDDLFSAKDDEGDIEDAEISSLNELIFKELPQKSREEKEPQEGATSKKRGKKTKLRKKSTHYLTPENSAQLDKLCSKIRRKVASHHKHKVSKSQIVNEAIEIVVRDLYANGEDSVLLRKMQKYLEEKQ